MVANTKSSISLAPKRMSQPYFQTITPHIHRLEFKWWGFSVCVWMVRESDDWSLIDTGPPGSSALLFAALEQLQATPTCVLLTHGHLDHVGNLKEIVTHFSLPVWCHALEAPYISGAARYRAISPARPSYRAMALAIPELIFPELPFQILEENQTCGGLKPIHVPGHAPGHVAFLHAQDRALLSADVFRFKRGTAMPLWTYDTEQARSSMKVLAALDFDHLLPSHGPPILGIGKHRAQLGTRF